LLPYLRIQSRCKHRIRNYRSNLDQDTPFDLQFGDTRRGSVRLGSMVKKMPNHHTMANLTPSSPRAMQWFLHLGGLGLLLLGLLDGSLVPILPGSMDIATILLVAHDKKLWLYYAAMATAGSVRGGFVTYRLARKGGKETLEGKFRGNNVQKIYKRFERWGFVAIAVSALLPPPIPFSPVVLTAGATRYSATNFLTALTLGRTVRNVSAERILARAVEFGEALHP
jgi:membrane protein YqaA with SNARE-associated domain